PLLARQKTICVPALSCDFVVPPPYCRPRATTASDRGEGDVSELRSALDGLAEVDFSELTDAGLLEVVAEWSTAVNRMTAALTSAVRAADRREAHKADGALSMKAWLRGSCHLAPAEATAIV